MLTDVQIRKAALRARPYRLTDGGGLHLWITPAGTRSWRWRAERGGRERIVTLGRYPRVSLAQARAERDRLRDGLEIAADLAPMRLRDAGAAWMAAQTPLWSPGHAQEVRASLEADVWPAIGERPALGDAMLGAITPPMLLRVLLVVQDRGAIELAHRLRQRVSSIYQHAIASGRATVNPAAGLERALAPVVRQARRPAVLDIDRARGVLAAVEATAAHPALLLAHRLLALTALRPGELRLGRWSEVENLDGAAPLWRVPPARLKHKKRELADLPEHLVPLSRQAVEALTALRLLSGHRPLLFPSWLRPREPVSENALIDLLRRAGLAGLQVPHGWRATFSSIMNEANPGDGRVIDLMLAHKPQGVEAAYNRATHMPRRRALAQEWADLLLRDAPPARALLDTRRRV